jgi:transcriptional regulator with PAS, ATPase and Fis domain
VSESTSAFEEIIGTHPLLLSALDLTAQVAPFATSVLLLGESGTGKEKIAEALHTLSKRQGLLVKVNCAAIPASLMESELFGYEKGAFTGANESRKGKFEIANGGTLFLDEIGELSIDLQARLLRVLQQKEIDPLGCAMPRKIDVRIVAATNRSLEKAIAEGNFRLDLYYRLNVFPIVLPALRDRKSDIMPLALHFAGRFCEESKRAFNGISTGMAEEILVYDWPGNIRELENVIQRSVILNDGKSELELRQHLVEKGQGDSGKTIIENFGDIKNLTRDTERSYILAALARTNGRIRGDDGAAGLLNIKPTTLESKMAKLGITKDNYKSQT